MEHLEIEHLVEFSKDKRIRKKLGGSPNMITELLCYEPGQGTPIHHHPQQEEIFYIVEGSGTIVIGDEEAQVTRSSLYFVPPQTRHGITAGDERLVILFFKAPGSTLIASGQ
jgi:quercetin dioxygenase-like cupin family protein